MKSRSRINRTIPLLMAVILCGCDYVYRWFPQTREAGTEVHKVARETFLPPTTIYHHTAQRHSHSARHEHLAVAKATAPAAGQPPPARPELTPTPPPAITMSDDSRSLDKLHAEQTLARTKARFAAINRGALNSSDTAIYDQAGHLLNAASQALQNDRYSLASGFASKASLLTDRLPDTSAGR